MDVYEDQSCLAFSLGERYCGRFGTRYRRLLWAQKWGAQGPGPVDTSEACCKRETFLCWAVLASEVADTVIEDTHTAEEFHGHEHLQLLMMREAGVLCGGQEIGESLRIVEPSRDEVVRLQ